MKVLFACALLCIGMLAPASRAQSIYKCVVNGATTFQQEPCASPVPTASRASSLPANFPLIGTWRSDRALTMAWLRQHATITKKQDAFLDQLVGHLMLTFTRDHMKSDMPDFPVQVDGKPFPMKGFHANSPYTVVSAGSQQASISSANAVTRVVEVSDYNFDDRDTMWQLMNAKGQNALDARAREYYRRVK